mmetsp:Transcript_62502/g.134310  ORF Transcript_62502/g.134310 Transcript_62502/m.134310 type:complete len:206 (+) Transcript_62502:87-704(+)
MDPVSRSALDSRCEGGPEELEVRCPQRHLRHRERQLGGGDLRIIEDALEFSHFECLPLFEVEEPIERQGGAEAPSASLLERPRGCSEHQALNEVGHPDHIVLIEIEGAEPLRALAQAPSTLQQPHRECLQRPPGLLQLLIIGRAGCNRCASAGTHTWWEAAAALWLLGLVTELGLEHAHCLSPVLVAEPSLHPDPTEVRNQRLRR